MPGGGGGARPGHEMVSKSSVLALGLCAVLAASVGTASAAVGDLSTDLKWCVGSTAALAKCEAMAAEVANIVGAGNKGFVCVKKEDCEGALADAEVDIISDIDGGDLVSLAKEGAILLGAESYSLGALSYYAVGVIRTEHCASGAIKMWKDLEGKRSCHTGYGKSAGWAMPVGTLAAKGIMPVVLSNEVGYLADNDIASAENFFSSSCAPMKDSKHVEHYADTMCKNCATSGEGFCCRGDKADCPGSDGYYNYHGSLRCLAEGNGDVAFVKHSTVPDFTEGGKSFANTDGWAWEKAAAKTSGYYSLVCEDGCKPISEYASCNFAAPPSHGIVGRPGISADDRDAAADIITAMSSNAKISELFFAGDNTDGVFKSSAKGLVGNTDGNTIAEFMGDSYAAYNEIQILAGARSKQAIKQIGDFKVVNEASSSTTASSSTEEKDEWSSTAVGLAAAGFTLAFLALVGVGVLILREKSGNPLFTKIDSSV